MKKKLSVRELKRYCEEHKPHCIYFKTENQAWYRTSDASILGTVITIFCGDFNTAGHDITYKLVVA